MARLRNRSADELETVVAGRRYNTPVDGVLDVPDEVYLDHAWSEVLWDEVEVPRRPDPESAADPAAGTVNDVKDRVGDDPDLAQAALDAENAKDQPRASLVAHLEAVVNNSREG